MNRTLRRPAKHTDEPMPTAFCLEYTAFRDLHLDWYLRYAYIRTGEWTKATHCVEAAFNALSAGWGHGSAQRLPSRPRLATAA
ncbi:hypothetical protein GA0115253_101888 [Streptomyces sp. Termitarium-T10T-6]|nr:hypothetical protein GA0115253_101888 [Streptomyces sp. Termitarium-T10T-6]